MCVLFNINKKYNCLILSFTSVTNRIIQSKIYSHLQRTEDLLVACNEIESSYYYYCSSSRFCARDFSETDGSILMKLSGKMCHKMVQMGFFQFFENHFRSRVMADFPFFKSHFVRQISPQRFEIESSNFQG